MNKNDMGRIKQTKKCQKLLLEFLWFFKEAMPILSENIYIAGKAISKNSNESLNILLESTVQHNIETLIFNIYEMWGILDITLKDLREQPLKIDKDYKDLDKIRNKILGHRIKNSIYSPQHMKWFKKNYGDSKNVLSLLDKVGERIKKRVQKLEKEGKIKCQRLQIKKSKKINKKDLENMLKVIK
jgi:hypothetical protein